MTSTKQRKWKKLLKRIFWLVTTLPFTLATPTHSENFTCQKCSESFLNLFNLTMEDVLEHSFPHTRNNSINFLDFRPGSCEATILYRNGKIHVHKMSRSFLQDQGNKIFLRHGVFLLSLLEIFHEIEKNLKVTPPGILFNFETQDNPRCRLYNQRLQHGSPIAIKGLIHHSFCSPQHCDGIVLLPISYNQRISAMEATKLIDEKCSKLKWEDRIEKLFWRGSVAGKKDEYALFDWKFAEMPRAKAIRTCKKMKDTDIKFGFVPWKKFTSHKYVLALAGNTYSSVFKHALRSGSCILRQEERMYEWYEPFVQEWVHYVPLNWDLSDINSKMKWIKEHASEAKKIALRARILGMKLFTPYIMSCYSYCVLERFKNFLNLDIDSINIDESFSEVHSVCHSKMKKRSFCQKIEK